MKGTGGRHASDGKETGSYNGNHRRRFFGRVLGTGRNDVKRTFILRRRVDTLLRDGTAASTFWYAPAYCLVRSHYTCGKSSHSKWAKRVCLGRNRNGDRHHVNLC